MADISSQYKLFLMCLMLITGTLNTIGNFFSKDINFLIKIFTLRNSDILDIDILYKYCIFYTIIRISAISQHNLTSDYYVNN